MNLSWMIGFAVTAALGNALFAIAQRQSIGMNNGLLFVAGSAAVAMVLCLVSAPLLGSITITAFRGYWRASLLGGVGLFLTYLGFNLLYTRFGTAPYVVYAALAILTTTVGVGFLYLKEPANSYRVAAVVLALVSIALFSLGQTGR